MSRIRLYAICAVGHLLFTFALFSALWLLPAEREGAFDRGCGALLDVLMQPFFGPRRLLALPSSLDAVGAGVPAMLLGSMLWAVPLTLLVLAIRRRAV